MASLFNMPALPERGPFALDDMLDLEWWGAR